MKLAVVAWNELEGLDIVADFVQCFSRHPGGSESVSSVLAVLYLDVQLVSCHKHNSSRTRIRVYPKTSFGLLTVLLLRAYRIVSGSFWIGCKSIIVLSA